MSDSKTPETDAISKEVGRLSYLWKLGDIDARTFVDLAQAELDKFGQLECERNEARRLESEVQSCCDGYLEQVDQLRARVALLESDFAWIEKNKYTVSFDLGSGLPLLSRGVAFPRFTGATLREAIARAKAQEP